MTGWTDMDKTEGSEIALAPKSNGNWASVPEWVQLLPTGPQVIARDGRKWSFNPAQIIAAFKANNGPLVVDYEHAQDLVAPSGSPAPAAGWIVELEDRLGAIWGKVEWTDRAATQIVEKAYRFLSPSMRHTKDGIITRLAGAGLVNRPALEMTALSRQSDVPANPLYATSLLDFSEELAATALAAAAQQYQAEQLNLGNHVSLTTAVSICRDRQNKA